MSRSTTTCNREKGDSYDHPSFLLFDKFTIVYILSLDIFLIVGYTIHIN
nr:MAG TPA: hypothetical protein [Caudoviricetes sp.]